MKNEKAEKLTQKDYASFFLLQSKAYKISISLTTFIFTGLIILINFLMTPEKMGNSMSLNFLKNSIEITLVMLLTSLSGYGVGSLSAFIVFCIETLRYGFVYQPIILMIASLISNFPVIRQWYKSKWKTVLSCLIFCLVLGVGSNLLIIFLENDALKNFRDAIKSYGFTSFAFWEIFFIGAYIVPCILVCLLCYIFFNYIPPKIRNLFFASSYESEKVRALKASLEKSKKKGSIDRTIFGIIVFEAVFLAVAAFGFSGGLLIKQFGNLRDDEMVLFISRLFFLMMMIAIPLILMSISKINVLITNPIRLMAKAVEDSSSVSVNKNVQDEDKIKLQDLNLKSQNEIGVLYETLILSQENTKAYLERIQREQELKKDLEVAETATKAKSVFLSNMSHEIRTPINAVLGLDEMILRESSEPEILHYAQDIQNAGKSLLSLVNDILDFSKIEAGKMEIIPTDYDLSSTVNDLINMMAKKAEDKGLTLNINIDENIPHLLNGDEIRIKQCVINILTNAVKYTEKGSVTLSFSYTKADEKNIDLTVHVKDTGIGIKEEDIGKLFTAFQRIEEKRNRTIEGTGLGMNIVQQLLGLMGSTLMVESVYGEGSDFYFTVRQEVIKWEPIGSFAESYKRIQSEAEKNRYHESFKAPNASILVTDDTALNLTVIKGLLKQTELNVDTAESGAETLKRCTQKKYDALFIDHRMPVMDGIETLQALKTLDGNLNKETPCIALTANAVNGAREMYINAGFTDYLTKPIDSQKLEKMLIHYLPKDKVEITQCEGECKTDEWQFAEDMQIFSGIEGICVKTALKNSGDKQILMDAMKEFYRSIDEKSVLIEQYANEKDWKNYTILVHALKSSARLIGAKELSSDAEYLEHCGDKEDEKEILEKTPALLTLYRSYKKNLGEFLNSSKNDEAKEEINEVEYKEALSGLKECLQAFDFSTADQIISMLETYEIPLAEKEKFEKIKAKVAEVDQAAVLELLQ